MSSSYCSLKTDNLRNNNFHAWKHIVELVLSLYELDEYLDDTPPPSLKSSDYLSWIKCYREAKAIIVITLSDNHLEQVQQASSALAMWNLICDIFEKHTLLNKLAARRKFCIASISVGEKVFFLFHPCSSTCRYSQIYGRCHRKKRNVHGVSK